MVYHYCRGREESSGLEAVEQADLLLRIRKAQDADEALCKQIKIESTRYHTASSGKYMFRNKVGGSIALPPFVCQTITC